ncbi:hypothetical protein [Altibacter sp. HG106]|uniref:hypothetical protein n=1 Tax=Altibacter sp. HG106 TaxID=3023937 RepID=UPI00234FFC66|nr:hypothetical protein [Altibacter sp. HG106]MDC7993778.1 hypothetical protein [Altibacter sp. HG106]
MKAFFYLFLVFTVSLSAQERGREKIKALKTAMITNQLDLSSQEAEKFWPIYNEYDQKMDAVRKKERSEIYHKLRSGVDNLSDTEADALIARSMELKAQELTYRQALIKNLRGVISSKKIIKLTKAEEDFKRKLLEEFRKRKRGQRP